MDPVTLIVMALAAGAAAGLKPTAEQAIKDAYAGVKALIQDKYAKVDLAPLERKPESEAKRKSVCEDLAETEAGKDQDLLEKAKALLEMLEKQAPETGAAIGIDLKEVKAAFLKVRDIAADDIILKVEKGEFTGGIELDKMQARKEKGPENP